MMTIFSGRRRVVRSQPWLPATSPLELSLFPTNRPLIPDRLIGRSKDVSDLVEALSRGEHRILIGPYKVGKTSVAQAAVAALEAKGWHSVAVDLFHTSDLAAFIDRLVEAAQVRAESTVPVAPTGVGEALKLLQRAAKASDGRVVLFIDELQEIATTHLFGSPDQLTEEMRAVLDQSSRVVCLFVGSVPYLMRKLFTSKDQAFYQFGSVVSLRPIPATEWRAELRSRFMEGGCEIDDIALDRLLELSEGHPRSTMLIAHWTYASVRARETSRIDRTLVEESFRAGVAGETAVNESKLAQVRTLGKYALATTLRVAKGESAYKNLPPAIARQTLRLLETAGVVDHPHPGAWRIADPLFREDLLRTMESTADTSSSADAAGATSTVGVTETADATPAVGGRVEDAIVPTPAPPTTAEPAAAAIAEVTLDPAHLSFRHPAPEEAADVGQVVAHAVASRGNGPRDPTEPTEASIPVSHQSTGRRFGRFVERTVASHPDWYRQLEADGKPVGGLVLYRPRALVGTETSTGIDPLAQLGLLALVMTLALVGCAVLIVEKAWTWGGLGGLLLAAFIGILVQTVLLGEGVLGRARASWIARRYGGAVVEGLWSEPEAMLAVFQALARELPGTLLTAHAETPHLVPAYRAAGFRAGHFRVVTGVLDPSKERPIRPEGAEVTGRLGMANGQQDVGAGGTAEQRKSGAETQSEPASDRRKSQVAKKGRRSRSRRAGPASGARRRRGRPRRS